MKKIFIVLVLGIVSLQFVSCNKSTTEPDYNAQLKKDIATIDAYLASQNITAEQDSSGVRYVIQTLGTGEKPSLIGMVGVKYVAILLASTQIDQSDGVIIDLSSPYLIESWKTMLPKMHKGTKFTMYVPSGLAYGPTGSVGIPPNSNLVFNIEVLDDAAQLLSDITAIDAYLDSIGATNVVKDPSGVRITYASQGSGQHPTASSTVDVTYTGRFFKSTDAFDTENSINLSLSDVIKGWQAGLPLVPAGSQFKLYIPSGLAYGPAGKYDQNGTLIIPRNEILVFDITLISTN